MKIKMNLMKHQRTQHPIKQGHNLIDKIIESYVKVEIIRLNQNQLFRS